MCRKDKGFSDYFVIGSEIELSIEGYRKLKFMEKTMVVIREQ
jgi:hypothetical protein